MQKRVFVFTTGRAGSLSLFRAFGENENFLSIHESRLYKKGNFNKIHSQEKIFPTIFNTNIFFNSNAKCWTNSFSIDKKFYGKLQKYYFDFEEVIKKCPKKKYIVNIDPYNYMSFDYLLEAYSDAIFILLIRNGYDVVNSYYSRKKTTYSDKLYLCNDKQIEFNLSKPVPNVYDAHYALWKNYDRVQKISWFWNHINYNIYKKISKISNGYVLKTEEITKIKDIFSNESFCGLSEKTNKSQIKSDLFVDKKNIIKFNNICQKTMKIFGYNVTK